MKFVLNRSLTFWSGLLVMGFIVWVWRDSLHHRYFLQLYQAKISNAGSRLWIERKQKFYEGNPHGRRELSEYFSGAKQGLMVRPEFRRGDGGATVEEIAEFGAWYSSASKAGDWSLLIPHWLVLLAVGLPWAALLLWRARRKNTTHREELADACKNVDGP